MPTWQSAKLGSMRRLGAASQRRQRYAAIAYRATITEDTTAPLVGQAK